jgi:hypothetical protein
VATLTIHPCEPSGRTSGDVLARIMARLEMRGLLSGVGGWARRTSGKAEGEAPNATGYIAPQRQSGRGLPHSKTQSVLRSAGRSAGFGVRQSSLHLTRISLALRLSFRLGPNVPAPRHCRRPVRGALHLLRSAERSTSPTASPVRFLASQNPGIIRSTARPQDRKSPASHLLLGSLELKCGAHSRQDLDGLNPPVDGGLASRSL